MSYSNYYSKTKLLHGALSNVMGTRLDMVLVGKEQAEAEVCWEEVQTLLLQLHAQLNRFSEESEVAQLNRYAAHYPYGVSNALFDILVCCREYTEKTQGFFDVTLGKMTAVEQIDMDKTVRFVEDSVQVDLGGFAKGYAMERIKTLLGAHGVERALLNFGNSAILAIGEHPLGDAWSVAINNPYRQAESLGVVKMVDCALSISGNMPSHTKHIFNPKTQTYADGRQLLVVKSKSPLEAEVLSTALMLADDAESELIASHFDIEEWKRYSV